MTDLLILLKCGSSYSSCQSSLSLPLLALPVCHRSVPEQRKGDLSSLARRNKWSKRARGGPRHPANSMPGELTIVSSPPETASTPEPAPELEIVAGRTKPFVYGVNFRVSRSVYRKKSFTVKTYVGRVTNPQAIQNEVNKWTAIDGFIGRVGDLRPGPHNIQDEEFHLIFNNSVPEFTKERDLHAPILEAFRVQIKETPEDGLTAFLNHTLSNPQELLWSESDPNTWIATPIFFATKSPIDEAVSLPTHWIAKGVDFFIFRTMYKNRPATLKTYFGTTGSEKVFRECDKWRKINLLVGTAVAPTLHRFYTMILGNSVPEIAINDIRKTIATAVGADVTARDYANPQEFVWIGWEHNHWSVTRIHFIAQGHLSEAIESASTSTPIGEGDGFSVFRAIYKRKVVSLKTYSLITANSMKEIHEYIMQWMRIRLLIGTAVELKPWNSASHHEVTQFHIIMNSCVQPGLSVDNMHAAIRKLLGEDGKYPADYANPQEYRWKLQASRGKPKWTATRIDFGPDNSMAHHSNA